MNDEGYLENEVMIGNGFTGGIIEEGGSMAITNTEIVGP